jgi:hypothetical protein
MGYTNVAQGKNFQLLPFNVGGTNLQIIFPVDGSMEWTAIQLFQEYSTQANWSPITALVFTSNTLPINPSQISTPLVYTS